MSHPARAMSYDAVAAAYDLGRPGYPPELVDDAVRLAGLVPGSRILEIGSGTGQATRPLASKGFEMTCLEPGRHLAAILRGHLAGRSSATVVERRFEDWPVEPGAYDLVLAATSLHHVAADVRYAKSARALRTAGSLVVLSNRPGEDDPAVRPAIDAAYARWWGPASAMEYASWPLDRWMAWLRDDMAGSGFFAAPELRQVTWTMAYDLPKYMAFLDADSGRLKHPAASQEGLKRDIAAVIARHGGVITRAFTSILAFSRRL
jgi:SAM-dependent methyltransferase